MATEDKWVRVVAYTPRQRIEGSILLLKGERLSDKLNVGERAFEAIHEARVYALDGERLIHESPYVAVNKNHVVMILPAERTEE